MGKHVFPTVDGLLVKSVVAVQIFLKRERKMRASFLSPQQSCPAGDAPLQHTEADDRRIIALRHCSDKKKHSSFRISNI